MRISSEEESTKTPPVRTDFFRSLLNCTIATNSKRRGTVQLRICGGGARQHCYPVLSAPRAVHALCSLSLQKAQNAVVRAALLPSSPADLMQAWRTCCGTSLLLPVQKISPGNRSISTMGSGGTSSTGLYPMRPPYNAIAKQRINSTT